MPQTVTTHKTSFRFVGLLHRRIGNLRPRASVLRMEF